MTFTDEELKYVREEIFDRDNYDFTEMFMPDQMKALLARLEAAEIKDCNQYHCGHAMCNVWRKAAGK